jgi:hypothetical protein
MAQKLTISEIHPAPEKKHINQEWITLHNEGDAAVNTEGCSVTVGKGGPSRPRLITKLKAGLILQPGEKARLITGSASKKSQGVPPEEGDIRNMHLFQKVGYLDRKGLTIRLVCGQLEICKTKYE